VRKGGTNLRGTYIKPVLSEFGRAYDLTAGAAGQNPDYVAVGVLAVPPVCDIPNHPSLSCLAI
jgi:hypothetical protein